jgi:hypothetical protein
LLIKFNVGVGVVWIVAGTIWTASDLCIAIGMVTVKGRTDDRAHRERSAALSMTTHELRRSANGATKEPLADFTGQGTILLVEDEQSLRSLIARGLLG